MSRSTWIACERRSWGRSTGTAVFYAVIAIGQLACTSATSIPDSDREHLELQLADQPRYLRVSMYQGPFWSDDSKYLLSDVPLDELDLLDDTQGHPMSPGGSIRVLPAGAHVRIAKVEFPTALVMAGRMVYSPRYNPWVYLTVVGQDTSRPSILVLPSGMTTRDQFLAELSRYVSEDDPSPALLTLAEEVRRAVAQKQVLPGMSTEVATMAWGYPTRKHIEEVGGSRSEVWTWDRSQRSLTFEDGKLKTIAPAPK